MKLASKIILPLLIFAITVAADSPSCQFCGQEISVQYFSYKLNTGPLIVCSDCDNELGHCARCGIPVSGTRSSDNKVICRLCRLQAPKCDVCGDSLIGQYYTDEADHKYCVTCYDSAERCALCSTIIHPGLWVMDHGEKICSTCRTNSPRCEGCDRLVSGRYSVYKGFDGVFCEQCVRDTPVCLSCLRPCGLHPHRLANGNRICRECARTAIDEKHELDGVIREVTRYLERNLLMRIEHEIEFQFVDSTGDRTRNDEHYRESGRFIRFGDDFTVKIIIGLSRAICIETVAHELAHAWQAESCPKLKGDEIVEGFAQWVASRVLTGMGYTDLVQRLDYRDDVYGRGYRLLTGMEERHGFSGIFRELERMGKSPE